MKKECTLCHGEKILTDFYPHPTCKLGVSSWCKQCSGEKAALDYKNNRPARVAKRDEWRKANPEKISQYRLKNRYGLTDEELAIMIDEQNGLCAICSTDLGDSFHIDHDHETKSVRGLLCRGCNHGLGNFMDNPILLMRAVQYLEMSKCF